MPEVKSTAPNNTRQHRFFQPQVLYLMLAPPTRSVCAAVRLGLMRNDETHARPSALSPVDLSEHVSTCL